MIAIGDQTDVYAVIQNWRSKSGDVHAESIYESIDGDTDEL